MPQFVQCGVAVCCLSHTCTCTCSYMCCTLPVYILQHPLGEISLHEARVEEVERSCDSDSDDTSMPDYTLAVWPPSESPTYLMITTRPEKVRGHSVMSVCCFSVLLTTSSCWSWDCDEGHDNWGRQSQASRCGLTRREVAFTCCSMQSVCQHSWLRHVRTLCCAGELALSLDGRLWGQRRL